MKFSILVLIIGLGLLWINNHDKVLERVKVDASKYELIEHRG